MLKLVDYFFIHICFLPSKKLSQGSSIYYVYTEREGGQVQVDARGRDKGVQLHVDVHTEN